MAEYGLNKNCEGYADPTAAEAIRRMAKPGEIWKYRGREVLIIKNQGGYSNILTLSDMPVKDKDSIEVARRHITPGKLNYAFNDQMAKFVYRLSDAEFNEVLNEVEAAFDGGIALRNPARVATATFATYKDMEAENESLKKKNTLLRKMYDELMDKFVEMQCGK